MYINVCSCELIHEELRRYALCISSWISSKPQTLIYIFTVNILIYCRGSDEQSGVASSTWATYSYVWGMSCRCWPAAYDEAEVNWKTECRNRRFEKRKPCQRSLLKMTQQREHVRQWCRYGERMWDSVMSRDGDRRWSNYHLKW